MENLYNFLELKNKIREELESNEVDVNDSLIEQLAEFYCEVGDIFLDSYVIDEDFELDKELLSLAIKRYKRQPKSIIYKFEREPLETVRPSNIAVDEYGESELEYEEGQRL